MASTARQARDGERPAWPDETTAGRGGSMVGVGRSGQRARGSAFAVGRRREMGSNRESVWRPQAGKKRESVGLREGKKERPR